MAIINNQGVFIAPPFAESDLTILTSFRNDNNFETGIFNEPVVFPNLPNNVGIAFIESSDSPANFATIALDGTDTSTIYVENTAGIASLAVSNNVYVGYKATLSGISGIGITGNLYVNGDAYVNGNVNVALNVDVTGDVTANEVTANEVTAGGITLTSRKAFDIPHPSKEGWRIRHICLEGPESAVYYRGRLTDSNVIDLPEYWVGLVDPESITVNLTQIRYSQDLIVEKIEENKKVFIKSNNSSNIDCYFLIHGERIDGEKLIVEYEGEEYPGDDRQYSLNR
jgi:hypothetical protein